MKKMLIVLCCLLFTVAAGNIWFFGLRHKDSEPTTTGVEKYTRLDIVLEAGKLATEAATYLVQPGTGLEFHISSDKLGKVSVPTEPPQTITFTKSPLVFKFKASHNPGSYALLYQAENSEQTIQIGTIVVREK